MKRAVSFLARYKFFTITMLGAAVALGLDLGGQDRAADIILGSISIVAVFPLLKDMWDHLRTGGYGIDILAVTAIVTAVLLGEYWAAIVVVVMLTGGEALEDYAEHRAKTELDDLLQRAPQTATVVRGRKTLSLPARDVVAGDKILLKPGETVPVDAVILEGGGDFDESSLTGESLPVAKQAGDELMSGSIGLDGAVTARCLRPAADSQYQQIVRLVEAASNSQAPFVRLADRYSVPFTIFAYVIAGTVWFISRDPMRFLEVIIVATPCPLLLAAPIAIVSGMSRSAKHGIIVKNGGALERLAEARTMAFDKTGTLTRGQLKIDEITAFDRFTEADVVAAAAALEQHSTHVLAQAILDAARDRSIKVAKVKALRETAGQGISATYGGKQVHVGRLGYLRSLDVAIPGGITRPKETATYVAIGGRLAGMMTFSDIIRPESRSTIERLRRLKFDHIMMVTGDNRTNARAVAKAVGISTDAVVSEALPADKLHAIEMVDKRPVAFVGDGVNDAPVLTAADVGIALGARGSTAASESADIVIMMDDVSRVAMAADIADRTFRIARQSILIGIAISLLLMLVFATGRFNPLTGALLQEVVDVIVIINALRAHGAARKQRA